MPMSVSAFNLTNAIGVAGFLISLIGYCIVRRVAAGEQTPSRMYCNARICWCIGLTKIGVGIFEIAYLGSSGGTWWGWILILFAIFWIVRGNKFRRTAQTLSIGYQPFDHNEVNHHQHHQQQQQQQNNNESESRQRRRSSNAPQIVVVSDTNTAPSQIIGHRSASSIYSGSAMASNSLQQPMISSAAEYNATPLIRNAVPPSPFTASQNETYVTPSIASSMSIPMATTITTTPRMLSDVSVVATSSTINNNDDNDDDDDDDDNTEIKVDDDGKNDKNEQTPKEPTNQQSSRKTSEGNVTFT